MLVLIGIEYWIESDVDIDEDTQLEECSISPPDLPPQEVSSDERELNFLLKWIVTLLSTFQTRFFLTDKAITWLLKFLFILFEFLGKYSPKVARLASKIPQSPFKMNSITGAGHDTFETRVACKQCDSIYEFKDCVSKVGSITTVRSCKFQPFKHIRECKMPLMKEIISCNGNQKLYPHRIFCFINLVSALQTLILRTGFLEQCESTRNKFSEAGFSDVSDGSIWKAFLSVNGVPFLSQSNNYGLLLNIDWFQPFEHVVYSVGVMYLAFLNLPRSIRFKRENIILCGIIPGPCEPSLTMNTYLAPLVTDLLKLWTGVQLKLPGTNVHETKFRCALIGIACDLPAARKCCGFLSYSANLGCSRCLEQFSQGFSQRNCYANFERQMWNMRSNSQHRSNVKETLKCTTKTKRAKKESELGCRYSVLLDLPYFRPIEMLLIDPMHNLFLGTAKHFARDLWIGRNILKSDQLAKIEHRLQNTVVPKGLGRIPVTINSGTFLTAEQWKSWTLYFSVYCLAQLLPKPQLECWRHFVLACRRLCKLSLTSDDITIADALLLRVCQRTVELYGTEAITPNMHMHCHLASSVREFGPIHNFWLFAFERYNGILGGQPTNNRSIELQLMRRFHKDNAHIQLCHEAKHWPHYEIFQKALPSTQYDMSSSLEFDMSVTPGYKSKLGCFSNDHISVLRKFYSNLYPVYANMLSDGSILIPSTFRKYSSITWRGKELTSTINKNVKNPFVFVSPPLSFTSSVQDEFEGTERLVCIDFFAMHSIILPDCEEPKSHLLACARWPMVHPERMHYGKPIEVWCKNLYEPIADNTFFLASTINSRAIICDDKLSQTGEFVLVAIPLIE